MSKSIVYVETSTKYGLYRDVYKDISIKKRLVLGLHYKIMFIEVLSF